MNKQLILNSIFYLVNLIFWGGLTSLGFLVFRTPYIGYGLPALIPPVSTIVIIVLMFNLLIINTWKSFKGKIKFLNTIHYLFITSALLSILLLLTKFALLLPALIIFVLSIPFFFLVWFFLGIKEIDNYIEKRKETKSE